VNTNSFSRAALKGCAGLTIGIIGAASCLAIDYQPGDWVPLTRNTGVLMSYYEFGTLNEYNNMITGPAKNRTHLDSHIGVARYLYYNEALHHPYVLDFILPFGALTHGEISGQNLGDASGLGDPIVSAGLWFVNQPKHGRYFSAADFLTLPLGTYDNQKTLNLGGNRWQNDVQLDFTQGFLNKFTIDVSGDWIYYWNNTDFGAAHQTLRQDSTFSAYVWLSYDISSVLCTQLPANISIGYAGTFGGIQKLEGINTGQKTGEEQIRLTYSQFVAPTWQILISVSHDVSVSGQFKQDFGLLLRVTKLF